MKQDILERILQAYFDTYNDERAFPREEYPALWEELDAIHEYFKEKS